MEMRWILLALHMAGISHTGISLEECEVQALRSQMFVPFGKWDLVNCTHTCPSAYWETRLRKKNTTTGINWVSIEVLVDDWEKSEAVCTYLPPSNILKKSSITVRAFVLPATVTIDLQGELEEDKEHNITCTVYDVAPVEFLTITVIKGGDVIHEKSLKEYLKKGIQTVHETYKLKATRNDNLQDFSCRATLNLGNETKTTESSSVTVRTYVLPEDPHIKVNSWIEYGTSAEVHCMVSRGFPTENVTLEMFDDKPLEVLTHILPNGTIWGSSTLSSHFSNAVGKKEVSCTSKVFDSSRTTTVNVNIYERPTINFTLSSVTVDLGDNVTAACSVTNSNAEHYVLSISVNGLGREERNPNLSHTVTASERSPTINISCKSNIRDNPDISQIEIKTINVHYPPQFNDQLCPDTDTWVEGKIGTFLCGAEGSPSPLINCSSALWSLLANTNFSVTRNMSTEYKCQASNSKGTAEKSIHVTVQYPPSTPTVILSTSTTISKGDSFNLTCQSDALPAPMYRWKIPTQDFVTYSLDNKSITINSASSSHQGAYTCEAVNRHGQSEGHQVVDIAKNKSWIWLVVIAAGVALIAIIMTTVCYFLRSQARKGFYDLLTRKPKCENGLPNENTKNTTTAI